jgi:hypothetical protein
MSYNSYDLGTVDKAQQKYNNNQCRNKF